jgi:hypothetical protein
MALLSLPKRLSPNRPADASHHDPSGGRTATFVSLFALVFSALSYYESALKQAELDAFVPPVIQYARDGGGDVELFSIPITIANSGSNTGTVLAMELTVTNPADKADPKSKTYYSAFIGEHSRETTGINRSFAPISVPGRASYSETIRFYPQGNPLPRLVQEAGEFAFTLKLTVAKPSDPSWLDRLIKIGAPEPLVFTRTLPWLSDQQVGMRRVAISMHAKDWKATSSAGK